MTTGNRPPGGGAPGYGAPDQRPTAPGAGALPAPDGRGQTELSTPALTPGGPGLPPAHGQAPAGYGQPPIAGHPQGTYGQTPPPYGHAAPGYANAASGQGAVHGAAAPYGASPQGGYGQAPAGYGQPPADYGQAPAGGSAYGAHFAPMPSTGTPYPFPPEDVDSGKILAVLGYLVSPLWIIPLVTRDNAFAIYHAKQALVLTVVGVALSIPIGVIAAVTCGVGAILYLPFLYPWLLGLLHAIRGEYQPMPWVGHFADQYLGSLQADQRKPRGNG